ncbi:recombinase family protein [Cellulomonas sp. SG140]|uniref:recombinase family protein n=1 Tax=Cellulomonas sp. SG140 TaxID=2976536 RepID=UPI0021E72E77|nr:recombinase family protein [Cellulomonas sp. SG140]
MQRGVIYVRISRDRAGAGLGVDRQEEDCRSLASRLGLEVAGVFSDNDLSAYSGRRRPGYEAMCSDLRAHKGTVVLCWHTDRLHRRTAELATFIDMAKATGTTVQTVTAGPLDLASPSGLLTARLVGAVAEHEIDHARERMARAKSQAAQSGTWLGGRRPFGYEADGVTIRPTEADALRTAAQGVLQGRSLRALAAEMALVGTSKVQAPVDAVALRRLLLRPRNAGLMEHQRKVIGKASWEPILDEETWTSVVAVLTDPSRKTTTTPDLRHLLSGVATCAICREPLKAHRGSRRRLSYTCEGRHVARDASALDRHVRALVADRLAQPDLADLLYTPPGDTTAATRAEAEQVRSRLADLADAYARDAISLDQMTRASEGLRARLSALEESLRRSIQHRPLEALMAAPEPRTAFLAAPLDVQRAVMDLLLQIEVMPGRRGRPKGWQPGQPYADLASVRTSWRTAAAGSAAA